jgi:hypothetical protein
MAVRHSPQQQQQSCKAVNGSSHCTRRRRRNPDGSVAWPAVNKSDVGGLFTLAFAAAASERVDMNIKVIDRTVSSHWPSTCSRSPSAELA